MWRSKRNKTDEAGAGAGAGGEEGAEVEKTAVEEPKQATSNSRLSASLLGKFFTNKLKKSATDVDDADRENSNEPVEEAEKEETEEGTTPINKPKWASLFGRSSKASIKTDDDDDDANGTAEEPTKLGTSSTNDEVEVEMSTDAGTLSIRGDTGSQSQSLPLSYAPSADRPSVHDEALEMLTGALLIYIFADLRDMAKAGIIDQTDLLTDPVAIHQVVQAIQNNKEALAERAIKHEDIGIRMKALKDIHGQQKKKAQRSDDDEAPTHIQQVLQGGAVASAAGLAQSKESVLAHFHDEKTTQGVVYGIAVNHLRKRVTCIFRGSVTSQDFITDANSSLKKVDNPVVVSIDPESHSHIKIHTGFYKYLFREDEDGKERLQHILDDVKQLMKEYEGYQLYSTGHSLGGACCTLFGFYAAMDDEIVQNGPVVVISIASPRVGGKEFADAFHSLEQDKRLQHLRIANKEDVVTHLPFYTFKATAMSPLITAFRGAGDLYLHCGISLELRSVIEDTDEEREGGDASDASRSRNFHLSHPKGKCLEKQQSSSFFNSPEMTAMKESVKSLAESLAPVRKADFETLTSYHSCTEYETRLLAGEDFFSTVTLDQLYQDTSIVGMSLTRGSS